MNAKEIIETNDFGVTKDGIKVPYPDATSSLQIGKNIGYVMGVRAERAKSKEDAEKIIAIIPTNWIDPLLSGPDSPLSDPPYGCPEVEGLLLALKNRIITAFGKEN